jgi:glycosyltransferase involved in cell wall biosynthesis
MPGVVIAAHNEESVIGACLGALLSQGVGADDIVVVANGCTDRTAERARDHGVTVIDLVEPGKAGALNAGDAAATGYPRIYLDADIVVPAGGIATVISMFESTPAPLAVVPARRVDVAGRPWPVRAYFAVNTRLPAFEHGLFGRGMIALSADGRARFTEFPPLVADDLFLDSQFSDEEKAVASSMQVAVEAPFTTHELLARLVRVRRGNGELRAAAAAGRVPSAVRPSDRWAWMRATVRHPPLWASAAAYAIITVIAGRRARMAAGDGSWGHDQGSRDRIQAMRDGAAS